MYVLVYLASQLIGDTNWDLGTLIFTEEGKPEDLEKNPRDKGENQRTTQLT
jgi:hypothetical protein